MDLLVRLKLPIIYSVFLVATISFAYGSRSLTVQKCVKVTHSQCLSAGYQNTAPFPNIDGKPFQEVKGKELNLYLGALKSCSKYSASVFCSLYFPKCVEHLPRPVLPCQSVCNDFVHSCGSRLDMAAMRGLFAASCSLLPLYDGNPDTCFIPDGFNVSLAQSGIDLSTCHKVTLPKCQDDLHYNFTFISNDTQTLSNVHLLTPIIASNCSPDIEKFTCFTRIPPCSDNKTAVVQIPCKSMCLQINQSCSHEFKRFSIPPSDCDFIYPDQPSSTGMCTLTKWPAPWVRVKPTSPPKPPPPTTKPNNCKYCQKITVKECVNAGYDYTFYFKETKGMAFQDFASKALEKIVKLLKCSPKYAQTILCSMYVPKCDPEKCEKKPVLPCRQVCHEFASSCVTELRIAALHGLFVGLCDLLPLKNTAETPCFVPTGFKPTSKAYARDVCFPIVNEHNRCTKDFSYNSTFITQDDQALVKIHALQKVIDSKCSPHAEKLFCYTRIPPCGRKDKLAVQLPCRWMCKAVLKECKDVFKKYGLPMIHCDVLLPDADGDSDGMCRADKFPVPYRQFKHPKPDSKHGSGVNAGLIAGIVILVLGIIVIAVLLVLYYRKKKNLGPFEPRVLHNVEEKDSSY